MFLTTCGKVAVGDAAATGRRTIAAIDGRRELGNGSQRRSGVTPQTPSTTPSTTPGEQRTVEHERLVRDHGHDTRADDMNPQNSSRLTVHTPSTRVIVPVWSP